MKLTKQCHAPHIKKEREREKRSLLRNQIQTLPSFTLHELSGPHMSVCVSIRGVFVKHRDAGVSPQSDLCSQSLCVGVIPPFLVCSASDHDLQRTPQFENCSAYFIHLTSHVKLSPSLPNWNINMIMS